MALTRQRTHNSNHWPGFVDALATLLMVIIFLLMVFVIAQVYLGVALSSKDDALSSLQLRLDELGAVLANEKSNAAALRLERDQLQGERDSLMGEIAALAQSLTENRSELNDQTRALSEQEQKLAERTAAIAGLQALLEQRSGDLTAAESRIASLSAEVSEQDLALAALTQALEVREKELELRLAELTRSRADLAATQNSLSDTEATLAERTEELGLATAASDEATRQIALLNSQLLGLRDQLASLQEALEASEALNTQQQTQLVSLGERLNRALATKVAQLQRYRSEFFGRLREVIGDRSDIRVVGDRFVFQSEVLFDSGSATLQSEGQIAMSRLAQTLATLSARIPDEIDWILRVDGHTDKRPISTAQFASNWELSSARAISVIRELAAQGLPRNRLVAAGFAEFQPLDNRDDEIAYRRNRRIELKLTQR